MSDSPSRKRKRVELDVTDSGAGSFVQESRSASDFAVSTVAKDVLEISEADPGAKFIKVFNSSTDKVWLRSTAGLHTNIVAT